MKNKLTDVFKRVDMSGGKDRCWPWKGAHNDKGMPVFDCDGRKHIAYRVVFALVHGELAKNEVPRHKCDNGAPAFLSGSVTGVCCNPYHLERGTHADNMRDMRERDRHGLPAHVVRAIRKLLDQGRPQHLIADLYGVSRETVSAIATGRTHGHVDNNEE